MPTRIEEILTRARDTLADPNKERYTDERLIRLIDDAQKTIALQAKVLRKKTRLFLNLNQQEYALPIDAHSIIRVLHPDFSVIRLVSHEEADRIYGEAWELHTGETLDAVIYDKNNTGQIKVYPIPNPVNKDLWSAGQQFGITTEADEYVVEDTYGVVSDFTDGDNLVNEFDSPYGVLSNFIAEPKGLTIYYLKKPDNVTLVTDELEISSAYDRAIKFYVTGMALRDDKDTQNRQVGNEELNLFTIELKQAISSSAQDETATRTQYNVPYIGAFD